MTEKSFVRRWRGNAATFVEDKQDGTVVVTVHDERAEMPKNEWDELAPHEGEPPKNFNKAPSDVAS